MDMLTIEEKKTQMISDWSLSELVDIVHQTLFWNRVLSTKCYSTYIFSLIQGLYAIYQSAHNVLAFAVTDF